MFLGLLDYKQIYLCNCLLIETCVFLILDEQIRRFVLFSFTHNNECAELVMVMVVKGLIACCKVMEDIELMWVFNT
jgi:hypothetical protein